MSEFIDLEFSKGPLGFTVDAPSQSGKPGAVVMRIRNKGLQKKGLKVHARIAKINGKNVGTRKLASITDELKQIITSKSWPLKLTFALPRDPMAEGKKARKSREQKKGKPRKKRNTRDRQDQDGGRQQSAEPQSQDGSSQGGGRGNKKNRRKGQNRRGPSQGQGGDRGDGGGRRGKKGRPAGRRQNERSRRDPNKREVRGNADSRMIFQEGDRVEGQGSGAYKGWFPGTITSVKFEHANGQYQYKIEYDQTKGKEYTIRARHLRPLEGPSGDAKAQTEESPAPAVAAAKTAAAAVPEAEVPNATRLKIIYLGQKAGLFQDAATSGLQMEPGDSETGDSITHCAIANMQSNILSSFSPQLPHVVTITDATAGLGGNSHSFAKFFNMVRAIEFDKERFGRLKNNMDILTRLENAKEKVRCVQGDALEIIPTAHDSKIVFFDPPWGGQDFREKEKADIFLMRSDGTRITVPQACNQIRESNPEVELIGLKLPYNYDQQNLLQQVFGCNVAEFQFSYTRIKEREDISQVLVVLDYHHNSKDFSMIFHGVHQNNRYVKAEILRRKNFVDTKQVGPETDAAHEEPTTLKAQAREFNPNNKRHALRGELEMLD